MSAPFIKHIATDLNWTDLVIDDLAMEQLEEIGEWLKWGEEILGMGLKKMIKPGYRALFYGPPSDRKILAATLLGKQAGLAVYQINLSMLISKYIGETEKNLAKIFDEATDKKWILFFDEADAIFGKRTEVKDAHDRYANQEITYLLQRIEDFPGVIILATNKRSNIDEAFLRRLQAAINFAMPEAPSSDLHEK